MLTRLRNRLETDFQLQYCGTNGHYTGLPQYGKKQTLCLRGSRLFRDSYGELLALRATVVDIVDGFLTEEGLWICGDKRTQREQGFIIFGCSETELPSFSIAVTITQEGDETFIVGIYAQRNKE